MVGSGTESGEGDLDLKSNPLGETGIPVELRAPSTKLEEETDAHDSDTELAELEPHTKQVRWWRPSGRLLSGIDQMLEHEHSKTMRSHVQLVSVSKARAVVFFVDFVVQSLER